MSLFRAFIGVYERYLESGHQEDKINAIMLFYDFYKRCDYISSVEGLIVSHLIRESIKSYLGMHYAKWIIVPMITVELLVNLFDDYLIFVLSGMGVKTHWDFYNIGILTGKFGKIIALYYLQGWHDLLMNIIDEIYWWL